MTRGFGWSRVLCPGLFFVCEGRHVEMAESYTIVFQPSGRRGEVPSGTTVLAAAQELGVGIEAVCGGKGVCGKCRVIIEEGRFEKLGIISGAAHVSERGSAEDKVFTDEEIKRGYRLACLTQIQGDIVVTVPEESRSVKQVILEKGKQRTFSVNPAVKQYRLELPPATLEDARDDRRRLLDALEAITGLRGLNVDYPVLRTLPRVLREKDWLVTAMVWQDTEVILSLIHI